MIGYLQENGGKVKFRDFYLKDNKYCITILYILTEMLKANGENSRFQNINANICTNLAENIKARVMDEISKKVGKQKV